MLLLSDPRVAAVPVDDDGDPLVDLRTVPGLRLDQRTDDPSGAYAWMRSDAAARLLDAQRKLPEGLRLLVIEGYRPYDAQLAIFTGYRDELRALHPEWPEDRVFVETTKFVSPVEVAPHSTGGAVDLTVCTEDGDELDMGTVVDATPVQSDNACFTAAENISPEARANRQLMGDALSSAGFINYPTEWWHWSYGDRYWAITTGAPAARFGPVKRS
jgi:zinc D-Ala-D-Ala dipeptidase